MENLSSNPSSNDCTYYVGTPKLYTTPYMYMKFKYEHPVTHKILQARIRLTKIYKSYSNKVDANRAIRAEIRSVTQSLKDGWTPDGYHSQSDTLVSLSELYISYTRDKLRPVSHLMMTYVIRRFTTYLRNHSMGMISPSQFTRRLSLQYSDYLLSFDIKISSYNNYLSILHTFFTWLSVRRLQDVDNVWNSLKDRNTQPKDRCPIPHTEDAKILSFFRAHNPVMELVIQMMYQLFLRPSEITKLKCTDIDLEHQKLIVPAEVSKTHRARPYVITDNLRDLLLRFGYTRCHHLLIGYAPKLHVLKGSLRQLVVGERVVESTYINRIDAIWINMRNSLNLPSTYKLYSYRDSGVQDLAQCGLPSDVVKMFTGHTCTNTVNTYDNHKSDTVRAKLLSEFMQSVGNRDQKKDAVTSIQQIIRESII